MLRKVLAAFVSLMILLGSAPAMAQSLGPDLNVLSDQRLSGLPLDGTTLNSSVNIYLQNSKDTIGFAVSGLTASGATLAIEASNDGGATWTTESGINSTTAGPIFSTLTTDQQFQVFAAGHTNVRLRVSNVGTGPITVSYTASNASSARVMIATGSVAITNFPTTQTIAGSVAITNFPATQTVAGSVTANLGTLNGAALAANQTNVQSALGAPATTAVTVQGSPSGAPVPVSGSVTANPGTGNFNILPAPTSSPSNAIAPNASPAPASSLILKASGGNVYNAMATSFSSTAGYLVLLNSATVPADGAITPLACVPLPATGSASITYSNGSPPGWYSSGIVAVITSGATCYTKTTSTITGFISGQVQ